ncbi:MAG: diaminopimelate epimerase [Ramlibacter sp.]|nr:diaminopimelate epimerase [Ramlibacter sp.]
MKIRFTKMQGAGNDFIVLDETRGSLGLNRTHYRFLADRRYGIGADQILSVRPATRLDTDFAYVIHNADGGEVEHCGNGARCFVRYVLEQGLTDKETIAVEVKRGTIVLQARADGLVTVDMGIPAFDSAVLPFEPQGVAQRQAQQATLWQLDLSAAGLEPVEAVLLSMGNPHAVLLVPDTREAQVEAIGRAVQALPAFPASVNVGFLQVLGRDHARLRVYERGVGETLACGSGACAAVVAGRQLGLLGSRVQVDARGGSLHIEWDGAGSRVMMTGPATTVYHGEIDLPEFPVLPTDQNEQFLA